MPSWRFFTRPTLDACIFPASLLAKAARLIRTKSWRTQAHTLRGRRWASRACRHEEGGSATKLSECTLRPSVLVAAPGPCRRVRLHRSTNATLRSNWPITGLAAAPGHNTPSSHSKTINGHLLHAPPQSACPTRLPRTFVLAQIKPQAPKSPRWCSRRGSIWGA